MTTKKEHPFDFSPLSEQDTLTHTIDFLYGLKTRSEADYLVDVALHLSQVLAVDTVLIGHLLPGNTAVETVMFWHQGHQQANITYGLAHTPSAQLDTADVCLYPQNVSAHFPQDTLLIRLHACAYASLPICDMEGRPIGLLVLLKQTPFDQPETLAPLLKMVALNTAVYLLDQDHREKYHQNEKLAALGQLIAGVAHELNNPLSSVILHTELLELRYKTLDIAPKLGRIAHDAHRAATIVKQLLDFARQRPSERKQTDLNKLITETMGLVNYNLHTHNIEVNLDLEPNLPTIWADPHQLQQVIINLVTNAQQAILSASRPGKTGRLTISTVMKGEAIQIEVEDNGSGIPTHLQSRIFDPFFTTKRAGEGTGLGLAVCHGIITEHGGAICFRSQPQQGTTFIIELPIRNTDGTANPPRETMSGTPVPTHSSSSNNHILIIDDEENLRYIMSNILELNNYVVTAVDNGRVALEQLQNTAYDLILCDINMPDMNGREFFDRLSSELNMAHYRTRLVFITGDILQNETRTFLEQTQAPCLHKPFDIADLLQAVQAKLNGSTGDSA